MNYSDINKKAAEIYGEKLVEENVNNNITKTDNSDVSIVNNKKKNIFIFLIIIIVVFLSTIFVLKYYNDKYKTPIKKSVDLINNGVTDWDEYYEYSYISEYVLEEDFFADEEDILLESSIDLLSSHYGSDFKVSYKILYANKIETKDLEYDDITKGYEVGITLIVEGKKDIEAMTYESYVYEIDKKWYLDPMITPYDIAYKLLDPAF